MPDRCQAHKAPAFESVLLQAKDIYSRAVEDGFVTDPLDFEPPASPELLSAIWWPTASDATRLLNHQKAREGLFGDLDLREMELNARENELKRRELKFATFKTLHLDRGMDLAYTAEKKDLQTLPRVKYSCFPALSALFPLRPSTQFLNQSSQGSSKQQNIFADVGWSFNKPKTSYFSSAASACHQRS